jgi:hypothetical protein
VGRAADRLYRPAGSGLRCGGNGIAGRPGLGRWAQRRLSQEPHKSEEGHGVRCAAYERQILRLSICRCEVGKLHKGSARGCRDRCDCCGKK